MDDIFDFNFGPNPISKEVIFSFSRSQNNQQIYFSIYNILGQLVNNTYISSVNNYHWDLSDNNGKAVSPGCYFAVCDNGEIIISKKLIIVK
jgi:flagellar hook assembly protein FlgD